MFKRRRWPNNLPRSTSIELKTIEPLLDSNDNSNGYLTPNISATNATNETYLRKAKVILDKDRRAMLTDNMEKLKSEILVEGTCLLDHLKSTKKQEGLSEEDIIKIKGMNDPEATEQIINIIKARPNRMFDRFCDTLEVTGQGHIVQELLWNKNDLENCRQKLAKEYERSFSDMSWYTSDGESDIISLQEMYVPMVWKKTEDPNMVYKDREIKSPLELFEQANKARTTRIVIEGEAGSGKTTFMKAICTSWIENVNQSGQNNLGAEGNYKYMSRYSILLALILRLVTNEHKTLKDIITNQFPLLTTTDVYAIFSLIEHKPGAICILFDGFDELEVFGQSELLDIVTRSNGKDFFGITTTRSIGVSMLQRYKSDAVKAHIKLCGFNEEQIEKYIQLYFKQNSAAASSMLETIQSQNLWKLASIPIRLQMMCFVWNIYRRLGKNKTDLYQMLLMGLIGHMEKRDGLEQTREEDIMNKYHESIFLPTAKLANQWDKHGNLKILNSITDIKAVIGVESYTNIMNFGCLTKYYASSTMAKILWNFTHLSLQEYFVAYHLAHSEDHLKEFSVSCFNIRTLEKYKVILEFLCNLSPDKSNKIITDVVLQYTSEYDCMEVLNHICQFMGAYKDISGVDIPLPRIVCLIPENNSGWITAPPIPLDKRADYLSYLFSKDAEKHRNMTVLKVFKLSEVPNKIQLNYIEGLFLNIGQQKELEEANVLVSHLSDKAISLDIVFENSKEANYDMKQLLNNIKTKSILLFSVKGTSVVPLASEIISSQSKLVVLSLNDTNTQKPSTTVTKNMCDEANKHETLQELRLVGSWLDSCITFLRKSLKLTICRKFETLAEFIQFSNDIIHRDPSITEMDLSYSNIGHDSEINSGKVIGQVFINLHNLVILKLRRCGITSDILRQVAKEIEGTSKNQVSVKELDLLGNCINYCHDIKELLVCCPQLSVTLITYTNESNLPNNSRHTVGSSLVATGTQGNSTVLNCSGSTCTFEKLYMIFVTPTFEKLESGCRIKILFILDVLDTEVIGAVISLSEALHYMMHLEELYFTRRELFNITCFDQFLSLIRTFPPSLRHVNLCGYESSELIQILKEKHHLQNLQKLNIGSIKTSTDTIQVIELEMQQLNNEMEVYCDPEEYLIALLSYSYENVTKEDFQSKETANDMISVLA